jgi:hypothetical protein
MVAVVDEFDEEAIRRLIYNFRATEKQLADLITSIHLVHENASFKGDKMSENHFEGAGFPVFETGSLHQVCVTVAFISLQTFGFGVGKPEITDS